jgi:DNA modification methylase
VSVRILIGDCRDKLRDLSDASVNCCVTSPPYFGLRDYGVDGQMGLEPTPDEFVAGMVEVFREVRRVLRDDGTLWLNIGDSYSGSGKGGNPEAGKQATNKGSQSVGVLYGKVGETARQAAVTNVTRDVEGIPPKNLIGIPWMLAFALRADGWFLRQDIIWSKPNPMPESVRDRCTKAHEYLFLLSKSQRYYFDAAAIAEKSVTSDIRRPYGSEGAWQLDGRPAEQRHGGKPRVPKTYTERKEAGEPSRHGLAGAAACGVGDFFTGEQRNKRSVWTVTLDPFPEAHFATYPPALIEPCILAGCPKGGTVLDPFGGAGTTGLVADRLQRDAILIELNPEYAEIARNRIASEAGMFGEVLAA